MTISINVSVNGNYKVPVTIKYGAGEPTTEVISGRGLTAPFVMQIPFYQSVNCQSVTVTVGPEEQDDGS